MRKSFQGYNSLHDISNITYHSFVLGSTTSMMKTLISEQYHSFWYHIQKYGTRKPCEGKQENASIRAVSMAPRDYLPTDISYQFLHNQN